MKKMLYVIICTLLLSIGSIFFFYQESWFVFFIPQKQTNTRSATHACSSAKEVTLWAWNNNSRFLKKETAEIIYGPDITQNIKLLLNSWFLFLEEEGLTDKQIIVQSVALSPCATQAFISINQYPFDKSASTHHKLMLIESLLKTIKENDIHILFIRLLIHHKPLIDDHLNFDVAWPVQGYLA